MRPILVASILSAFALTAAAATPTPATDASGAAPASLVVSTGVTEAQLLRSVKIEIPTDALATFSNPAELVLSVKLDETGTPTGMHVVHSINPEVDSRVMKAVRSFRWRPAVLDNQTIPVNVNLVVDVQH
jgi:outer membrane biosynthesis protein TonB